MTKEEKIAKLRANIAALGEDFKYYAREYGTMHKITRNIGEALKVAQRRLTGLILGS